MAGGHEYSNPDGGLLAAAVLVGLAGLGVAVPAASAMAVSLTSPRVHSFSPARGAAGTKVTITWSGFARVTAVRFGGVAAAFRVRSASRITAVVPAMPSAAVRITVTTRAGTATSRARFTVTPRVKLSPATGPPGSVVTVSGTGFGALEGADVFAGTTDEALAGTSPAGSFGSVTVTIGASAVPGTAWISAEGRHSRLFAQAAFTVNTNWAQFRFSGTHTGFNPYENVLSAATVGRLGLAWSFRTRNLFESSPAVVNGVVYVGSDDGKLYALNAATGAMWWSFRTGGTVRSSPAVVNGVVYVGSDDGKLYALNAATGAMRWSFRASLGISSPAVANGVVYVGSEDRNVYALNATTGARLWSFGFGRFVESSPAVADGVVYIASVDGNVFALDAATGATLWTFSTSTSFRSSPAVANGVVYIGTNSNVYALDAATGARLWTFPSADNIDSSPAVANGMVYIGTDNDNVYAFGLVGGPAAPARPNRNTLPDAVASGGAARSWGGVAKKMAIGCGRAAMQ